MSGTLETEIQTDYLVVGAGAVGMGFVDTLLDNSDADVVMIDRRDRPGGHWLDSYPFVQLHQPSMNYGVNSTPLGQDRVEAGGRDAGFYERASGTEICGYYDEIMRHRFLTSGRVRFFPMCDYLGDGRFRSRLTGSDAHVAVRRAVVDATYTASHVPATDPPPFAVAEGVPCVPIGALTQVATPAAGYVIIGAGKTAMDAACWLLDRGVTPTDITWVRPRDPWILNRAFFQPGSGVVKTFGGIVQELEAIAESDSIDDAYARLEEREIVFRIDPSAAPTMLKGATASLGELEQLRRIDHVVRLGYVERIEPDTIALQYGSIPTSLDHVHVHCASAGLGANPPKPIFDDHTITLQPVARASTSLSAAVLGFVEASQRSTAEKNQLCPPNPWFDTPFDFSRHLLTGMRTEMGWQGNPDLTNWVDSSRFNLMRGINEDPDTAAVSDLQGRFITALFPALTKLDEFTAHASPAERARMFSA